MGIVAFCPQGHRVKVKDDLAGRKGICPQCGARFRIPDVAAAPGPAVTPTSASGPAEVAGETGSASGLPVARFVSLDAELAATLPRVLPLAPPPAGGTDD